MNKEEEFKKHLRDLVESKSFPFEESDWISAKKVIDAQRRKKRRLPFILFLAGLGALTLLFWPTSGKRTIALKQGPVAAPEILPVVQIPSDKISKAVEPTVPLISKGSTTQNRNLNKNITDRNPEEKVVEEVVVTSPDTKSESGNSFAFPPSKKSSAVLPILTPLATLKSEEDYSAVESQKEYPEDTVSSKENPTEKVAASDTVPATNANLTATAEIALQGADSSTNTESSVVPESKEFKKRTLISAEGGFNVLVGWKGADKAEGRGINPILGLNYHGQVSEKLECSAGFNLTTIMGLSSFSDTSRVIRYGFGEESEVTVISPRTLYYINFPLRLMWNFNLKQSAGFNLEPGYLVNASSQVETYIQNTSISEQEQKKEFGYTQGLATFNLQFGLFYRQRLYDRIYLQPEVFIGLKDLKDNSFFNSTITERSSGIKLTLLYSLLHR